jgi:hypothetical protein
MPAMSKKQKKHLKELSVRCHELEMSEALNKLFDDFQNWKKGEIDVWDLNQNIHIHHDTTARNLYKFYEMVRSPENAVARGVSRGIIKMDDIQKDCHTFVERLVEYYDQNKKDSTTI